MPAENKLTFIRNSDRIADNRSRYGWYKCAGCGEEKEILISGVKSGRIKSCGCQRHVRKYNIKTKNLKEYKTWCGLKERCYNENCKNYKYYGARGIVICNRWLDKDSGFQNFLEDMGFCPPDKDSLDRKNNNGNYDPENCRWATMEKDQPRNRRSNKYYEHNGERKLYVEWNEQYGLPRSTFRHRIVAGWSFERTVSTPVKKRV